MAYALIIGLLLWALVLTHQLRWLHEECQKQAEKQLQINTFLRNELLKLKGK